MQLLSKQIQSYKPYNEQEEKDKQTMLKYIQTFDNILTRDNEFAHFTASAWAIKPKKTKVFFPFTFKLYLPF